MDGNDNNFDKVTIRVKISDDDYLDMLFDWSKIHTYDMDKAIFEQLSTFTGIQIEAVGSITLLNYRYPDSLSFQRTINNPCSDKRCFRRVPYKPVGPHHYSIQERFSMRDGDYYRLTASARLDPDLDNIFVRYGLLHQDLVDETECNRRFCHSKGSRVFLDKLAKVVNSDIDTYLSNLPDRPRPNVIPFEGTEALFYDDEWQDRHDLKVQDICRDLNIGQYLLSSCPVNSYHDTMQRRFPRLYCRNRG
ncbi:uncharacterized protein LOC107368211 [Tetranychus urticae]|uniref:Uncharacterized protein n=1 Tax=Tetranychus urticae TaxID=32264 RepID=T1KY30_TETUR|nr:uncharacterized protein LOC107368211 [Tetranychus urticae]